MTNFKSFWIPYRGYSLILLFFLCSSMIASAHALPVAYTPDGFSSTSTLPGQLMIRFSEPISPTSSGIEIFSPSGEKSSETVAEVDDSDPTVLTTSIVPQGNGVYLVSWHGVSAVDGHFTKGAYTFFAGDTNSIPEMYGGVPKTNQNMWSRFWGGIFPSLNEKRKLWSIVRMDGTRKIVVTDIGAKGDSLRFTAYEGDHHPVLGSVPSVILHNAKEGIGPLVVPTIDRGEGAYDLPLSLLTPHGEWRIAVTWKQEKEYDISATISIDYPKEINEARKSSANKIYIFSVILFVLLLSASAVALWYKLRHGRSSSEFGK